MIPGPDIAAGFAHIYERDGADVWGFAQTLTIPQDFATDLENDEFGTSVAVDGDTAVIGAPGVSLAFVYSRAATLTEWELESTLESTEELTIEFGSSVDIDGDTLVVNTQAYGENLHVYSRDPTDNSWTFDAVLLTGSFDVAISDGFIVGSDVWVRYNETWQEIDGLKFATAVAVSGNQVIAGDTSVNAFIYTIPEALWFQTQQLEANAADSNENFGEAMDIDNVNDNMVICDAEHSDGSVGRAYLYERVDGEWSNIQVLTEGPAGEDYEYCLDAAIDGEWLAVVANGGVHMYQLVDGLWVNFQDLQLPLGVGDCFSCSFSFVDLSDDTLILGQYGIISPGAAHIFSNDGTEWSYLQTLESPDGGPDDNFGFLGGVSSDQILVTDDENDSNGDKAGSVYAYARTPDGDWEFEQKIVLETPSPGAEFGSRLAFSNGVAVVAVSGLHRYSENKYVVSKDSTGWGIRSVIQTDGFVLGLSGDATRIATPTVSFTQLSNGTWVEDLSFEDFRPGRAVAVSSSGDAVIIVEHDNTAQVYSLVDILGAEEETSSNVGTGVGASRLGEFP